MAFTEKLPKWDAVGVEPPDTLKASGFTSGYKPPAAYFNWFWHSVCQCLDELRNMDPSDIGALRTIQSIADKTDLNNLTTPGFYYCISDAKVSEYANCPTTYAFYLEVGKHAGTFQMLVEYGTKIAKIYFRNLYAGSWGEWQRIYTTMDNPTAEAVGAISEDVEVLSSTSITEAAIAQPNGTVKHYALSGESYAGSDLPWDGYKFGNATVFKRYAMATIVLWGAPNVNEFAARYYNNGVWTEWQVFLNKSYLPLSVSNGGTGATTANGAANNLQVKSITGGINIDGNTDLDSITEVGNYECSAATTAATLLNCPVSRSFLLTVGHPNGTVSYRYQELIDWDSGTRYYRWYHVSGAKWSPWRTTYDTETKPTPNDIGALPLSGGKLTGQLALTSGVHYGSTLPAAGTAGRIFFKKV